MLPAFDRAKKPHESDISYDSKVLRTVVVPIKVMTLFQAMAHSNTFKNIETCGVLTGVLVCIFFINTSFKYQTIFLNNYKNANDKIHRYFT